MKVIKSIVVVLICLLGYSIAFAQESTCEEQLNVATEEYAAGRFYGIPGMLKPCIDKGFSREQRQRAYLLLTQVYLLLEDPIAAETSYLEVLRANPEYTTDPARDAIEVVYLSKKFTADPIFSLFGKFGPTAAMPRVIHDVDMASSTGITTEKYLIKPSIQAEVGVEWHFYDRFSATGALNYANLAFGFKESYKHDRDIEEMTERQNWVSIPLAIRYTDNKGKWRPYGFIGYSVDFLLSDKAQFNIYNREPDGNSQDAESPEINMMPNRNTLNRSFLLGGGTRFKFGLDYFTIEARYSLGLSNVVNPERLYTNTDGGTNRDVFPYGHVDNYFRLDNLAISIGYIHPLYKPRKLKEARTRAVLKDVKKQGDEQ